MTQSGSGGRRELLCEERRVPPASATARPLAAVLCIGLLWPATAPAAVVGWTAQFGTRFPDDANGLTIGPNGNLFVIGQTSGELPGQKNAGMIDAFLRRYDPAGRRGVDPPVRQRRARHPEGCDARRRRQRLRCRPDLRKPAGAELGRRLGRLPPQVHPCRRRGLDQPVRWRRRRERRFRPGRQRRQRLRRRRHPGGAAGPDQHRRLRRLHRQVRRRRKAGLG